MVRIGGTKIEPLNYSYSRSGSENEDCETQFQKCNNLNKTTVFDRFQALNHAEAITLFDEDLYITRYDENEAYPFLQISGISSYIIIERIPEMEIKAVKNITEWTNVEASSTPSKSVSSATQCSDLDITGSPLRCPFQNIEQTDLSGSFQEPESRKKHKFPLKTFQGFSLDKARYIASNLRSSLKTLKNDGLFLPPIWVSCDGQDFQKTMFVGVHVAEEGGNSSTLSMTTSGVFIGAEMLPTIDSINSHFAFGCLQPRLNTKVEAIYEVMPRKDGKSSSLDLCSRWKRPLSTLSPPGLDAITTANLHLELGDEESHARFLFLEFEILRNLIDGLKDGCMTWYQKKMNKSVNEALQDYFTVFSMKDEKNKGARNSLTLDKIVEDKFLTMRPSMEFTDKIWAILKESESLSELTDGFKEVFKNISAGVIRPRIHVRNDTEFSVICRDLVKGQGRTPSLDKWQAIQMLIEIGLEKIKKDYVNVFQVCDLAATEQLTPYTSWSVKTLPYEECLAKLKKLQVVLQIVVILRSVLNLPNSVLCHLTSKTLLDLENKTDLPNEFEFQVNTSSVKDILNNTMPSMWTYETWSKREENSGCSKWMKFAVKRDEVFFKVESEGQKDLISPLNDTEISKSEEPTFYCLFLSRTEDILL